MYSFECSTTVCDNQTGALLFYINGVTVWDASHNIMPNGTGIFPGPKVVHREPLLFRYRAAIPSIIFLPARTFLQNGVSGYDYSIVDMSLNGGLGDVVTKNVSLYTPGTENLFFIKNADSTGYWIATHEFSTNRFVCYPFTSSGILAPVYSSSGITYSTAVNAVGAIEFSPRWEKNDCFLLKGRGKLRFFDFDNATGIVSNPIDFGPGIGNNTSNYSLEVSPDNKLIYVSEENTNSVVSVRYFFRQCSYHIFYYGNPAHWRAMPCNLGPDGKIYVAHSSSQYVRGN